MTGFTFDTGERGGLGNGFYVDRADSLHMAVMDSLPENAPQSDIDAALVAAVLDTLYRPKRAATVRRHFVSIFALIAPLAHREPAQFDSLITEFVERVSSLPD